MGKKNVQKQLLIAFHLVCRFLCVGLHTQVAGITSLISQNGSVLPVTCANLLHPL